MRQVLLELSTFIEDTVGDMLSLRLEPSDLRLDPPTPEALHESMAALINKGLSCLFYTVGLQVLLCHLQPVQAKALISRL